ncbi:MAG: hypothetical protein L3K06_08055 [Thermoplasmata archaeon]|nr:hypothetical protein [Thermoplasmata archaeon]
MRPDEYWPGAKFATFGKHCNGDLPENLPEPDPTKSMLASSTCRVTFVRKDSPKGDAGPKFEILLCVGERIGVVLEARDFVDAFLAVVPRWFWKPKDERP